MCAEIMATLSLRTSDGVLQGTTTVVRCHSPKAPRTAEPASSMVIHNFV